MPTPLVVYFCGFTLTGKAEIGLAYGLSAFDCDLHFRSSVNMHEEEKLRQRKVNSQQLNQKKFAIEAKFSVESLFQSYCKPPP